MTSRFVMGMSATASVLRLFFSHKNNNPSVRKIFEAINIAIRQIDQTGTRAKVVCPLGFVPLPMLSDDPIAGDVCPLEVVTFTVLICDTTEGVCPLEVVLFPVLICVTFEVVCPLGFVLFHVLFCDAKDIKNI